MIKTICKNVAFSETGKCLLGDECICEANKLWIENSDNISDCADISCKDFGCEGDCKNQYIPWKEIYDKLDQEALNVDQWEYGLPSLEFHHDIIERIKSTYTVSRKEQ